MEDRVREQFVLAGQFAQALGVRNIDMPLLPDRVHQAANTGNDVSGMPPVRTDAP